MDTVMLFAVTDLTRQETEQMGLVSGPARITNGMSKENTRQT
jgi:hypothetical protein